MTSVITPCFITTYGVMELSFLKFSKILFYTKTRVKVIAIRWHMFCQTTRYNKQAYGRTEMRSKYTGKLKAI